MTLILLCSTSSPPKFDSSFRLEQTQDFKTYHRDRAELARQGSLADRAPPASLAARRQNSNPSDPGVASGGSTSHSQVK